MAFFLFVLRFCATLSTASGDMSSIAEGSTPITSATAPVMGSTLAIAGKAVGTTSDDSASAGKTLDCLKLRGCLSRGGGSSAAALARAWSLLSSYLASQFSASSSSVTACTTIGTSTPRISSRRVAHMACSSSTVRLVFTMTNSDKVSGHLPKLARHLSQRQLKFTRCLWQVASRCLTAPGSIPQFSSTRLIHLMQFVFQPRLCM